jgi:hypothetical protein
MWQGFTSILDSGQGKMPVILHGLVRCELKMRRFGIRRIRIGRILKQAEKIRANDKKFPAREFATQLRNKGVMVHNMTPFSSAIPV